MAGPIYKLWMFRPKEAWYQLSKEERDSATNKIMEDIEKVGGKSVVICTPTWSSEQWMAFGIEEYPNIEAVQKFTDILVERDHFRYIESVSMLGTKWPPS